MRSAQSPAAGGTLFLRKGLVTAQVALSFLLLFGAGLFVRSLQNLKATDTGFHEIENLVTFQLAPALNGYERRAWCNFISTARNVRAIPGVSEPRLLRCRCCMDGSGTARYGRRPSIQGWRGHAGVHELALARIFRDDGHSNPQGRDFDRRDIKEDSKVAIVNRKIRTALSSATGAP